MADTIQNNKMISVSKNYTRKSSPLLKSVQIKSECSCFKPLINSYKIHIFKI